MQQLIFVILVLAALALIGLVLIQHGKGADVGASFGSGASNTMFGSVGSMPFLTKLTGIIAIIFFVACIALGYFTVKQARQETKALTLPATQQTITLPVKGQTTPATASMPKPVKK